MVQCSSLSVASSPEETSENQDNVGFSASSDGIGNGWLVSAGAETGRSSSAEKSVLEINSEQMGTLRRFFGDTWPVDSGFTTALRNFRFLDELIKLGLGDVLLPLGRGSDNGTLVLYSIELFASLDGSFERLRLGLPGDDFCFFTLDRFFDLFERRLEELRNLRRFALEVRFFTAILVALRS